MIEPQPETNDQSEIALSLDADRLQAEVQADNLIDDLKARLADENADWRRILFEIMAEWPLAGEWVGLDVKAMRTQKASVATKHLSNSLKIFKKLLKISRSLSERKIQAMIAERDYEELDLYVMQRLLGG